jgi:hypothetical protein
MRTHDRIRIGSFQLSGYHSNLFANLPSPSADNASNGSVKKYYRAANNR